MMKYYTIGQIGKRYKVPLKDVYLWRLKLNKAFGSRGRGGVGMVSDKELYGRCVYPDWLVDMFPQVPNLDKSSLGYPMVNSTSITKIFVQRCDIQSVNAQVRVNANPEYFPDSIKKVEVAQPQLVKNDKDISQPIIHLRGPKYVNHSEDIDSKQLGWCYWRSLELADKHRFKSIAFPCISTETKDYPNDLAAFIAIPTVKNYIRSTNTKTGIEKVIFITSSKTDEDIYKSLLNYF